MRRSIWCIREEFKQLSLHIEPSACKLTSTATARMPALAAQAVIYFCGLKGMMPGMLLFDTPWYTGY